MKIGDFVVNTKMRLPGTWPAFEQWAGHHKGVVVGSDGRPLGLRDVVMTTGHRSRWYVSSCKVLSESQ